jgi:2-haloacid dehalogenase
MTPITNVSACVFDAYGTLFDVQQSIVLRVRERVGELTDRLVRHWREKQLQYTWLLSLMGKYVDFWHVTGQSLDHTMRTLGVTDLALRARLMELYLDLKAFPDTIPALSDLKRRGMKIAILSNGTPTMLTAAVTAAGLAHSLDNVFSADEIKMYKPHPSVYQLACDRLGLDKSRICFVSANAWDASGAANFGFQTVWLNRNAAEPDELPGELAQIVRSLAELPGLIGK